MKFSDILGHESIKDRLRAMADRDRIPHALLLEGPSGIGKLALARVFAQYVHCEHRTPDGEPCGVCPSCVQHATFNHPDLFYVFPIFKKKAGKDAYCDDFISEWHEFLEESPYADFGRWVRTINAGTSQPVIYNSEGNAVLRKVSVKSYASRYKIMILWLPEKMNVECANRLLKMIEEPYEDTLLLFVSDKPEEILPTIYSRVQRLLLKPLPTALVAHYLEKHYAVAPQDAMAIANVAEGSIVRAEAQLNVDEETQFFLEQFKRLMRSAYKKDLRDLKDWSEEVADLKREKCRQFLAYVARMVRENFIYNLGVPQLNYLNKEEDAFSKKFSPFINERNAPGIIAELDRAASDIGRNANAKIVLFDVAIKIIIALRM